MDTFNFLRTKFRLYFIFLTLLLEMT